MRLAAHAWLAAWVWLFAGAVALRMAGPARADARGTMLPLHLAHASHPVPRGAPTTAAYIPPADARGAPRVVVVLHGWTCCAATMIVDRPERCAGRVRSAWGLGARTDESGTPTLLLVPQLSLAYRNGHAGRFTERGFFAAWLDEALDALDARQPGVAARWRGAPVALVAHSAGYETALAIVRDPSSAAHVRFVALLDALYGGAPAFVRWLADDSARRLLSVHTAAATTRAENARLAALAAHTLGTTALGARVRIEATRAAHGALPGLLFARITKEFKDMQIANTP
jgi:hypothetical protein